MAVERLIRTLLARPWVVVVVLVAATALSAVYLPTIQLKTDTASLAPKDDPVIQELEQSIEDFGSQDIMMIALKGDVFTPAALAEVDRLAGLLSDIPGVDEVRTPLDAQVIRGDEFGLQISPIVDHVPETPDEVKTFREALASSRRGSGMVAKDGQALAIFLTLEPHIMASQRAQVVAGEVETLVQREVIARARAGTSPFDEAHIVGEAYMGYSASRSMRRDLRVLMPLAVAVVITTLYASFRSAFDVAAIMGGIVMSLVWTIGLMAGLGYNLTLVSMILPIILVSMGSAAGIHMVNRFREEAASAKSLADVKDAIVKVVSQLTGPIAMTNLTTAVGFASFLTSFVPPVREFGAFAAAGIVFNMAITLTWIPAILVLRAARRAASGAATLVPAIDGGPGARRFTLQRGLETLGRFTTSRPRPVLAAAVALTLAFALGIPRLRVETNFREYFRKDSVFTRATQMVEDLFGGTLTLSVVVDSGVEDGIKDPAIIARMLELETELGAVPGVTHPSSVASLVRDVNRALRGGDSTYHDELPDSREAVAQELLLFTMQGGGSLDSMVSYDFRKALVTARITNMPTSQLRETISVIEALAARVFAGSGATTAVVGLPRVMVVLMDRFMASQLKSLAFSAVGVWLVVAVITGSALLGLLCLVALCISVVVNFGLMAFSGIPLDVVTIMISGICIGIGIDYSIHFVSRYRLELRAEEDKRAALVRTTGSTGRGILFNAATLMLGFGLLAFSGFKVISVFGLLVATAMFTSAAGAMVVLPAVLQLIRAELVSGSSVGGHRTLTPT